MTEQTEWNQEAIDLRHQYSLTRESKGKMLFDLQFSHSDEIVGGTKVTISHEQPSSVEFIFDWYRPNMTEAERTVTCPPGRKMTFHTKPAAMLQVRWRVV